MSLTIGTVLFAASVLTGSDWLVAIANVVVGVELERYSPSAGVISITLGVLLLLLALLNRRRRRGRKGAADTGAKSRALRDALVRRVRDHVIPVPA